jgi:hypothetical protein
LGVSVLIPTRSRPKRFKTAVDSLLQTKTGEVEVLSYVDFDDPDVGDYENPTILGPRLTLTSALKRLIEKASFDLMLLGSDDIIFKTQGWDEKMVKAMPKDCIGIVYAHDGGPKNLNHFMFHKKWYSLTGLFPDDFEHFGPDTYVGKVAEGLGRKILVGDVLIEHHHAKNGKAKSDLTYEYPRTSGMVERDTKRLREHEKQRIPAEIELLKQHCL